MSAWQLIEAMPPPVDQKIVFAYFGPDERWHGLVVVVKQFQWESMAEPLATGWPAHTVEPTHWMPLPDPPEQPK